MTIKEKLIESMFSYQDEHDSIVVDKGGLANHLIANDVVPVVRCKDCKHLETIEDSCPYCTWHYSGCALNDFCSYGERRAE